MLDCRIDLQCSPSHLVNFIQSVSEKNKIMERSRKALFFICYEYNVLPGGRFGAS